MKINCQKVLVIIFSPLVIISCGNEKADVDPQTELRTVRSIVISTPENGVTRTFSGTAKADFQSNLSFRVSGTIETLEFNVGDQLKAGQVIATLDPSDYQLQAQQAVANLAQADATLRNAKANFERTKSLYENNNISRDQLDTARSNADSSAAQVRASNKALELARLNVSYTKLYAAETCGVAEKNAEQNEYVTAGQTILVVTCGEQLEIGLDIPESVIGQIKNDMDALITFSVAPDIEFMGKVTEVGVASSASTTYPVTVALEQTPEGLRPGLAAQVSFRFENDSQLDHFVVPAVAVGEDVSGKYIYIVENTSKDNVGVIKKQKVQTGELTPSGLEIIEGVKEGDRVVTAGVNIVREGLEVISQ
ncbi:MAG: efflux RND transporter periplasmic adaptor subunit [Pseudomonadota bacterium]